MDSLRLAIPDLMKYIQEMYQKQEISEEAKDTICQLLLRNDKMAIQRILKPIAFFGSSAAAEMIRKLSEKGG